MDHTLGTPALRVVCPCPFYQFTSVWCPSLLLLWMCFQWLLLLSLSRELKSLLSLIPTFSLSVSSVGFPSRISPKYIYIVLFIFIPIIIVRTTILTFLGPCNGLEIGLQIFAFAPCLPLISYLMWFPLFAVFQTCWFSSYCSDTSTSFSLIL